MKEISEIRLELLHLVKDTGYYHSISNLIDNSERLYEYINWGPSAAKDVAIDCKSNCLENIVNTKTKDKISYFDIWDAERKERLQLK